MNRNKLINSTKKRPLTATCRGNFLNLTATADIGRISNTVKRFNLVEGVTLTEAVVAMCIMVIAAIGATSYQYHAARHSRIAREQITATRTSQLLLEDWKSTGGSNIYNPVNLGLGFSSSLPVPNGYAGTEIPGSPVNDGVYTITVDGLPMTIMLKWRDIGYDGIAEVSLRELTIITSFEKYDTEDVTNGSSLENMPPLILTTYVRIDGTSG